ncbi:MAG: hypothetical protein MIO92_05945 [Methanosarcinaceae archaeon]|nr:hypothetical protein [Methanosarcinaceae archaeon]
MNDAQRLIIVQALATLAKEQASNEDHDNLQDTINLLHQQVFELVAI